MVVGIFTLSQSLLINVSEPTIYCITGVCSFPFFRVVHSQGEQMFQWERRTSEYLLFNVLTKPPSQLHKIAWKRAEKRLRKVYAEKLCHICCPEKSLSVTARHNSEHRPDLTRSRTMNGYYEEKNREKNVSLIFCPSPNTSRVPLYKQTSMQIA